MSEKLDIIDEHLPTVLIIDDTPTNIQLLAQTLRHSFAIQIAANGPAALNLLKENEKPDLILLDIMMPVMDGYEVCGYIKSDPATRHIPVIFLSAMDEISNQQKGFDLGAVDFITKPFDVPLVAARINVHIKLKQKTEMLEKLAFIDGLTDIPNRRALEDTLAKEWGRARRSGKALSVLMIDIDYFKAFNDHYGHGTGDECLTKVAQALKTGLKRPADFIGRYGGEEFAAILPDCDAAGAAIVAEKLRLLVEALGIHHGHSPIANWVTVSIGYTSHIMRPESSSLHLMSEADQALYLAKAKGRNQVQCASLESNEPIA